MAQTSVIGFLESQVAFIEREAYAIRYPDIQYPMLIPVSTEANEWSRSITHYSTDRIGAARWFAAAAQDMPLADITKDQHEVGIEMAAIGYGYTLEELGQAMLVPGTNLQADRAMSARRAAEEYLDNIAMYGDTSMGFVGLINADSTAPATPTGSRPTVMQTAEQSGTGTDIYWAQKTPDDIIGDLQRLISGVYESTLQVEMADTLALPVGAFTDLASRRLTDTSETLLAFIQRSNVYTALTGQPLMIRTIRGLERAGAAHTKGTAGAVSTVPDNSGRAIAYRRDPTVLKFHIPMPHRFEEVFQSGPLSFVVPGIFRTGGVEFRRPQATRYMDGISAPPA